MMSQIQATPNRLGRVLGYFADAANYVQYVRARANTPIDSGGRKRGFFAALSLMAERDAYASSETMDVETIYKLAMVSAWFYSGVKLIADRVSSKESSMNVKRIKGEETIDINNHPFERLLAHPNSLMTRDFLMTYTTFWYYLKGEAYIFISTLYPGVGEPEELWPLPANAMRPLPATLRKSKLTGRMCIDYEYTVNGQLFLLPGENVIHIRNPNPFDYWSGFSFVSAMLQFLRIDHEQGKYTEEFYGRDNAVPTAIISLPEETDQEAFDFAKEQIREEFGEKRRSAIIRAGDFTVQMLSHNFQQADFVNMRKFNRDSLWQILGIPEGINSGSMSGDSRLAAEIAFIRNTVQPLLDRYAAEFSVNVVLYWDDDLIVEAPSIVPQDRAIKMQEYTTYSPDRLINENRKLLGLPEIEQTGLPLLDLMLALPIRLHAFVASNSFSTSLNPPPEDTSPTVDDISQSETGDGFPLENTPNNPIIGDMSGTISPKNLMAEETGKSDVYGYVEAAMRSELKTWKKLAVKDANAGKDPSLRQFVSAIIPDATKRNIYASIKGRDEAGVREIFDRFLTTKDVTPIS